LALELTISDVDAGYGAVRALHGVSLKVSAGETIALLGTNGNGKSTLMKCVMGMVRPTKGTVVLEMDGARHDLTRLSTEQIVNLGVALVPEGRRLFPKLTVEENLLLGAFRPQARKEMNKNRDFVMEVFPVLAERRRQLAGSMSGGQQQMLAIGRSLMAGPKLLLLDEPSLGLAPILVDQIFELLARLREQGTTILLVEQNVHRALELADRAYVLASGEIEREGPAAELRASAEIERAYLGIGVS
jgi:branched-chain amino acid transport system ATP-binding protein